jgi:hypothetical protein
MEEFDEIDMRKARELSGGLLRICVCFPDGTIVDKYSGAAKMVHIREAMSLVDRVADRPVLFEC